MPNEMIRPCTLWGQTFDACDVKAVNDYLTFEEESASPSMGYSCGVLIRDPFKGDIASPVYKNKIESYKAIMEAITTIANALNAPVLATKAVLAGLPQGSNFIAHKVGYSPIWQSAFYCTESQQWWSEDEPLDESYIIKSDGCSKTLARLLEFTLDGMRIKEGG